MQRSLFTARYHSLFEQQQGRETSAQWRVYRDAVDPPGSRTSLPQIVELLKKVCDDCLFYPKRDGTVEDEEYGIYGASMLTKKALYEELIRQVLLCHYEELLESTSLREDVACVLAPDILPLLREPALVSVRTRLRDCALTLAVQAFRDPRTRKIKRKAATVYAHLLCRLGGSLTAASEQPSRGPHSDIIAQQK